MFKPLLAGCLLLGLGMPAVAQNTETGAATEAAAEVTYARPELLIEAADLEQQASGPPLLLDARPQEEYAQGHPPGAIWVDVDQWKVAFGDGTDKLGWSERIGKLGIDSHRPVVVYDGALTGRAARVWWILTYWGVEDVAILNGGMKAWQAADGPTTTNTPEIEARAFAVDPQRNRLMTHRQLAEKLGNADPFKLFDTRTAAEHEQGKIATCIHLDWQDLVDSQTGKLLPAAELKQVLAQAGFDPSQPTVTYCQSGGRSSVMAFTLELMGSRRVANYYGSWAEWSRRELPTAEGN